MVRIEVCLTTVIRLIDAQLRQNYYNYLCQRDRRRGESLLFLIAACTRYKKRRRDDDEADDDDDVYFYIWYTYSRWTMTEQIDNVVSVFATWSITVLTMSI